MVVEDVSSGDTPNGGGVQRVRSTAKYADSLVYAACFGFALLFFTLFLIDLSNKAKSSAVSSAPVELPVSADVLLSGRTNLLGDTYSPYTLVEFGDYECPPCRALQKSVSAALNKYPGKVRFDFRNLPLTQIHPHAMSAAIAAESVESKDKYWHIHDALFTSTLEKDAIRKLLAMQSVSTSNKLTRLASKRISQDMALAKRLSVNATPTFLLCKPDGKVVQLPNLQALGDTIR